MYDIALTMIVEEQGKLESGFCAEESSRWVIGGGGISDDIWIVEMRMIGRMIDQLKSVEKMVKKVAASSPHGVFDHG